jgi:hypothetical protein
MKQLGNPPDVDEEMARIVGEVFHARGVGTIDADGTTGRKDYLERILGLIRATGFTVAIFSHETRPGSMANIALELGFAAMCGKPLVVVKSKEAQAPSDLKRTDWIEYDVDNLPRFHEKLGQALDVLDSLRDFEEDLLEIALGARSIDCAIAFERAQKGFLLSRSETFINAADVILQRLSTVDSDDGIDDLERLRKELMTFQKQAQRALAEG